MFKICDVKVRCCRRRRISTPKESGLLHVYKRGKGCFSLGLPFEKVRVPIT